MGLTLGEFSGTWRIGKKAARGRKVITIEDALACEK
jgi:hypothetical protein